MLPRGVITTAIDTMVRVIRWLNPAATSTAAKTAEQAMAIAGFVFIGIILGVILSASCGLLGRTRLG